MTRDLGIKTSAHRDPEIHLWSEYSYAFILEYYRRNRFDPTFYDKWTHRHFLKLTDSKSYRKYPQ